VRRVSAPSDEVVVVGAGRSTLIAELVADGWDGITAVDISAAALGHLQVLLGADASAVRFVECDVTEFEVDRPVSVWHDRATFHFLVDVADQRRYALRAADAVRSGGHLVLAGFAEHGPEQCSGLLVARHSPQSLIEIFAPDFELLDTVEVDHVTPWGVSQTFLHTLWRRRSAA
jgi:SAM-dependent methyltransferase